jgi:hypothetical protein
VARVIRKVVLQNLIFDNQSLLSHRILAAILEGILQLPPIKQAIANKQIE